MICWAGQVLNYWNFYIYIYFKCLPHLIYNTFQGKLFISWVRWTEVRTGERKTPIKGITWLSQRSEVSLFWVALMKKIELRAVHLFPLCEVDLETHVGEYTSGIIYSDQNQVFQRAIKFDLIWWVFLHRWLLSSSGFANVHHQSPSKVIFISETEKMLGTGCLCTDRVFPHSCRVVSEASKDVLKVLKSLFMLYSDSFQLINYWFM